MLRGIQSNRDAQVAAMFRRYVRKAGLKDFGMYDIKGFSATSMYRAGVDLARIQLLCGHDSQTTTEVYIKARLPYVAMPNMREIPDSKAAEVAAPICIG
jgi:site-specific recombinase XerD